MSWASCDDNFAAVVLKERRNARGDVNYFEVPAKCLTCCGCQPQNVGLLEVR